MNIEQRPKIGLVGYNYSHYPELDHAPAFAWSGEQEADSEPHHISDDEEDVQNRRLLDEGDEENEEDEEDEGDEGDEEITWDGRKTMTR